MAASGSDYVALAEYIKFHKQKVDIKDLLKNLTFATTVKNKILNAPDDNNISLNTKNIDDLLDIALKIYNAFKEPTELIFRGNIPGDIVNQRSSAISQPNVQNNNNTSVPTITVVQQTNTNDKQINEQYNRIPLFEKD